MSMSTFMDTRGEVGGLYREIEDLGKPKKVQHHECTKEG